MSRIIAFITLLLLLQPTALLADNSDYIWNIQFEKKLTNARAGDTKAQYDVGNMYLKGQGTKRNPEEAFNWFQKAAEKGHVRAEFKIGFMYFRGEENLPKNGPEAFKWLSRSAEKGYTPAQFYIGKMYSAGFGVNKDYDKALSWYKKADEQGYFPAKAELQKLAALVEQDREQQQAERARRATSQQAREQQREPEKPVVVAKAEPKPEGKDYRELLTTGKWFNGTQPALYMPSSKTSCQTQNGKFTCLSPEVDRQEPYGTVTYKVETILNQVTGNGEFTASYRDNVTLVLPVDPDDPEGVVPINYGWQQPVSLSCSFKEDNEVVCQDAKQRRLVFSKR